VVKCGCSSAAGAIGVSDTPSVDLSLVASILTAAVKLDPAGGNLLQQVANGLRVDCAAVAACVGGASAVHVADSPGIDFTESGAGTVVDPRIISGDLKAVFLQSSAATWTHSIVAANGVFEKITELPNLAATVPGLYFVTADAVGNATIPVNAGGSAVAAAVSFYLAKNDVLVPNTETQIPLVSQGNPTVAQPALGVQNEGSASRIVQLAAGDFLSIWGMRNSGAGAVSQILSSNAGRTRITAIRIGA
jgi:hypothetical protein